MFESRAFRSMASSSETPGVTGTAFTGVAARHASAARRNAILICTLS
jgi:hypothetical protein